MGGKEGRLKVVLCWHMHQPDYRGPDQSDFQLPWVYLHGIKDYVDMAGHLESNPKAKAVVNFAPVLLEQIDDYVAMIDGWLERGEALRDPLLAALAGPRVPTKLEARRELMAACLKANEQRLINRFPPLQKLAALARDALHKPELASYLGDQFLVDLLVWYHLAWMGEVPRTADPRIRALEDQKSGFTTGQRRLLVEIIGDQMRGIIDRYRRLAEWGQVELSVTPYAHPIVPLLLDLQSAKEALPHNPMPLAREYPGGEQRAHWHIRRGISVFERHFGFRPAGCWPSEGAVSTATLRLLEAEGFQWAASGQKVLEHSLHSCGPSECLPQNWVHSPYRLDHGKLHCFFRDDGLSDFIGFTYANWHADDAVANLMGHLERIADDSVGRPCRIVSIIMDGENAWEYYPKNGWFFLNALYERLTEHPRIELTTFSEFLGKRHKPSPTLPRLVAGSWVYGTFSTWIGDKDKNRAWDMLVEAKQAFDRVMASGRLTAEQRAAAELQLAYCEGSDWFWWFGDYNPGDTVSDFERLFRSQLSHLYAMIGEPAPAYLTTVFAHGSGAPEMGGVMRR